MANRACEEKGLEITREKTEYMVISKRSEKPVCPKQLETKLVGKVEQFQYLGSEIKKFGIAKTVL